MTPTEARRALDHRFAQGEVATIAGADVDGTLDLSGLDLGNVDLSGTAISGDLVLDRAVLRGLVWLKRARISGRLSLRDALCHGDLRLDDARLDGGLDAARAEFRGSSTSIARMSRVPPTSGGSPPSATSPCPARASTRR